MVVYGHDPYENFSATVGRRLERNPPENTLVKYFRPSTITDDHMDLSRRDKERASRAGGKELSTFARELYGGKLPTVVDLHDFPLYNHNNGSLLQEFDTYWIIYPGVNKKLERILENFRNSHEQKAKIALAPVFRTGGNNELAFEFFPVKIRADGSFDTMKVEDAEKMVREVISYHQRNYYVI